MKSSSTILTTTVMYTSFPFESCIIFESGFQRQNLWIRNIAFRFTAYLLLQEHNVLVQLKNNTKKMIPRETSQKQAHLLQNLMLFIYFNGSVCLFFSFFLKCCMNISESPACLISTAQFRWWSKGNILYFAHLWHCCQRMSWQWHTHTYTLW